MAKAYSDGYRDACPSLESQIEELRTKNRQLHTAFAAANERAEKAEASARFSEKGREDAIQREYKLISECDTIRTENAALREGLERIIEAEAGEGADSCYMQSIAGETLDALARLTTHQGDPQ